MASSVTEGQSHGSSVTGVHRSVTGHKTTVLQLGAWNAKSEPKSVSGARLLGLLEKIFSVKLHFS